MLSQNKAVKVLYWSLETLLINWQYIYALLMQRFTIRIIDVSDILLKI